MNDFLLISDYKHDPVMRHSLNELARNTFGIDFEDWYAGGYWDGNYVPFSLVSNGRIVANVSANHVEMIHHGEPKTATMIGTVMTHPAYRGQGLAAQLMRHVIATHEATCDFIYLFANDTVLDFYPKFGLQRATETECSLTLDNQPGLLSSFGALDWRKLDLNDPREKVQLMHLFDTRVPVTDVLGVTNNRSLLQFYLLTSLTDSVYYSPCLNIAAIATWESVTLFLKDVFSPQPFSLSEVACTLAAMHPETRGITFGFLPKLDDFINIEYNIHKDNLFVNDNAVLGKFLFPELSRA